MYIMYRIFFQCVHTVTKLKIFHVLEYKTYI